MTSATHGATSDYAHLIRTVEDYPKPGIQFKDITPLLQNPAAFRAAVDDLAERVRAVPFDTIAAIDARGFLFGAALAYCAEKPLAIVRKRGKLPYRTVETEYALEYGTAGAALHVDALESGPRTLIVDDVIATGGTATAAVELIKQLGGEVAAVAALIELAYLNGRARFPETELIALISYGE